MAPHGTDARQTIRESFVQCVPSPASDKQLNADHNCPLDTCTLTPRGEPGPDKSSNGRAL